jgi:hypothetical protein
MLLVAVCLCLQKAKYTTNDSVHTITNKLSVSPMWYELIKNKNSIPAGRGIKIRNGQQSIIWDWQLAV